MAKSWQDVSQDEFFQLASSPEGEAIANRHHERIYGVGTLHSMMHSCPCAHQAVEELLNPKLNVKLSDIQIGDELQVGRDVWEKVTNVWSTADGTTYVDLEGRWYPTLMWMGSIVQVRRPSP